MSLSSSGPGAVGTPDAVPAPADGGRDPRRWVWIAVSATALLVLTYWAAVHTVLGQRIENAALRGADQVSAADDVAASSQLSLITLFSFGAISAVLVVVAFVRGGVRLAVGAAVVLAGSTVITEVLKRVLPRPGLIPVTGDYTHNSFPSGHTTIAMAVLFTLLLVVPHRWRGIAVAAGALFSVAIGAQTVTAKWHRVSDTIGGDLVALAVACLVLAWLARAQGLRTVHRRRRLRVWTVGAVLVLATALAAVLGVLILVLGDIPVAPDPVRDYNAFLASNTLALAGSGLAALVLWSSLHQLETAARRPAVLRRRRGTADRPPGGGL